MSVFKAYKVTCLITLKCYIGITRRTLAARWQDHLEAVREGRKARIAAAIRKYGEDNFVMEHIASARTAGDLFELERILIEQENTFRAGYNVTLGGEGPRGLTHSPESRARMRAAHLGKKPSPETLAKMSAAHRGRKMPPMSEEWRAKIGAKARGRKWKEGQRERVVAKLKGRVFTPEWRAKISAAKKGKKQSAEEVRAKSERLKGRKQPPRSEEYRANISKAKAAWWVRRKALGMGRAGPTPSQPVA